MLNIGIVTGQEIRKNRDSSFDVRLLQVNLGTEANPDTQTVQYFPMAGDDSPPQKGDQVAVLSLGSSFRIALGVRDSVTPSMPAGAKKLYSRNSAGEIACFINLLSTGDLELNGNADTAVKFAAMNIQMQLLVGAINTALAGKLDGSGTIGALSLDLSTAESEKVKLP